MSSPSSLNPEATDSPNTRPPMSPSESSIFSVFKMTKGCVMLKVKRHVSIYKYIYTPSLNYVNALLIIQLFQKTLSKEKQKAHKPRLQDNMGIFETSLQCRHHIAKIFQVARDMDERSARV